MGATASIVALRWLKHASCLRLHAALESGFDDSQGRMREGEGRGPALVVQRRTRFMKPRLCGLAGGFLSSPRRTMALPNVASSQKANVTY